MNWAMQVGKNNNCDIAICAGDFFDKPECNAEELSALHKINWPDTMKYYFLCGNHELGSANHVFSSTKLFKLLPNAEVIDSINVKSFDTFNLAFLPYILESDRLSKNWLADVKTQCDCKKPTLLISHNDIAGIQLGKFKSQIGFDLNELSESANFVINGHLHNGSQLLPNVVNIGSLSGMNFSNDSSNYNYGAMIFDTSNFTFEFIENPYSFNFYKFDATGFKPSFYELKNNAVITLKCNATDADYYRQLLAENQKIIQSRLVLNLSSVNGSNTNSAATKDLSVNHIVEFKKFITEQLGTDPIVLEELEEICK